MSSADSHQHGSFLGRLAVVCLLLISFSANVAALLLPFMKMRQGVGSDPYSLFSSVSLMWEKGLYGLAILVVTFSILFPFAKLGVLFWVSVSRELGGRQRWLLAWVERLGKWSLLDVFLVSMILSLASRQFFVDAKPQLGLSLFICAILLSMVSGELLSRRHAASAKRLDSEGRPSGVLLLVSGLALGAALSFPFLGIEDWLLLNREYSILTLVPALWGQEAWLAAILTGAFLVATPLAVWLAGFLVWLRKRPGWAKGVDADWIAFVHRWSMLDVFGLSLVVFVVESGQLMRTELRWGALFLGATLLLQSVLYYALERQTGRGELGE